MSDPVTALDGTFLELEGLGFKSEGHDTPPWPEDEKVLADELGPYLAELDGAGRADSA